MSLSTTLRYIANHPLNRTTRLSAISRFIKWQINVRLNPYPVIYPFTNKAKLIVAKGMTGATGNLYCGLHEFNDMGFLLHFLREEDLFIDIGANIGSYTILASAHVGAKTISFEPVPITFNHLIRNIQINGAHDKVRAFNVAIGSSKGFVEFTSTLDTTNHVATKDDKETIQVSIDVLDDILEGKEIPTLMKIDVEGFETEVIKGAEGTLMNERMKAVIIELNGSGLQYGYDENKIDAKFRELGFKLFSYDPLKRFLSESMVNDKYRHNSIYIKDLNFVRSRIASADKVKIRDANF